jgi:hypothetical protein
MILISAVVDVRQIPSLARNEIDVMRFEYNLKEDLIKLKLDS